MGKIVNRVTQLHLKHAYFPRIDSQIDLLKKYCSVKTMNVGFDESQNSERQRACDRKRQTLQNWADDQYSVAAADVFMAKHEDRILF